MKKLLLMMALIASQSITAQTHTEWVLLDQMDTKHNKASQLALGASVNLGIAKGSIPDTQRSLGHYGFGATLKHNFHVSNKNLFGYEIAINTQDKTSFTDASGNLMSVALWDAAVLATYNYALHPKFSIGASSGVSFVWGKMSNHPSVNFFSRFEPVFGVQSNFHLNQHLSVGVSYRHYLGIARDKAYQSRRAAPSIDRLALGINYVF